jgi:hypothetical protein
LDDIYPKADRRKVILSGGTRLDSKAICNDAAIAFLFLAQTRLGFSADNLYRLVTAYINYDDCDYIGPILGAFEDDNPASTMRSSLQTTAAEEIDEIQSRPDDIEPSSDPEARESEVESAESDTTRPPLSSTKVLQFPDEMPFFRTDVQYMDIWEPHGSQPSTLARCHLWGAWKQRDENAEWTAVLVFPKRKMAKDVENRIFTQLLCSSSFSIELKTHWVNLLQALYGDPGIK